MEDRSGQVLGVAITFLITTWITITLRCYVRVFMVKAFGVDDWTMLATLCFFTAYLTCQIGGAVHGTGVRRIHLTDESAQTALRFWYFCEIFYTLSTCMLKISVGFFLLRITTIRWQIWIVQMIMVVSGIVGIGYTSVVIFQCKPISYWWNLDPNATGKCLSSTAVMYFTFAVSGLNSFADWTFAALPVLLVKDLQMKKRMKVVVAGVIALAAIGSTATIIRLPYTKSLEGYKGDFLYRTVDFAMWSTIEVGLGIAAGSIATLRPLMKQAFEFTRSASAMPWSKPSINKSGQDSQQLTDLKPAIKKSITITTSRARRESAASDEERCLGTSPPQEQWQNQQGLPGYITSNVLDERSGRPKDGRNRVQMDHVRRGSPGGHSDLSVDSKDTDKLPPSHNQF